MNNKESPTDTITIFGLVNLVEIAVEAITAGHDYRRSDFSPSSSESRNDSTVAAFNSSAGRVLIIVNIDSQTSGILKSQVSSWKRIIMNLCGNALKYTQSGFVHIALGAQTAPPTSTKLAQRHITLQVSDSGKGISQDYLKNDLFTPFAQEDQLSVGTGLGLSIVRQLVSALGGSIDVQSEVGHGTAVKVAVPIDDYPHVSRPDPEYFGSLVTDTRKRCEGLKLCIVGFEYYPDIGEEPTGILSAYARCMLVLKSSATDTAADWFGMEVITASSLVDASGDISVVLRSKWNPLEKYKEAQPIILLDDSSEARSCDAEGVFSLSRM